ncbi:hypothetical protein F4556_004497 [Kitasatospora gansuensis]|uniref:Uncharacterized protein n=1 Tax=Kitasatospora gansuensis TaxID=258050 RepID=A0A7W7SEQ3_9ACTN|nr:hypothetical protein [Kitasatospora gansuensis]MBB4948962.1 hypothetical protein [Kitasatospora gansuensis]
MAEELPSLAAELEALVDVPGPVSTVDAYRAQRDGEARLRRRRRGAVAAVGVAVVVAATLSLTLPGGGGQSLGPAGPGSPSAVPSFSRSPLSTPSPTRLPSALPSGAATQTTAPYTGRSPLTAEAEFGWLPERVRTVRYQLSPMGLTMIAETDDAGDSPTRFSLQAFPAGTTPPMSDFPGGSHALKVPAPPVNGQEAYWVSSDDPGYAQALNILRWKSPDGRWLELTSDHLSAADRQQLPLRIAETAVVERRSIPLPLRLDGIPPGFVLSSASFERRNGSGPESWRVELIYSSTPGKYFSTVVTPGGGAGCKSSGGVSACVGMDMANALADLGGAEGWLAKVTLLGADPANWTTDVLN